MQCQSPNSKWFITPYNEDLTKRLSRRLGIHSITAKILANRGIKTEDEGRRFLNPKLSHLPDPFLLPDMEKATDRICKAIMHGEKVAIFGDYDTDGITSTALLVRFFRECGVEVHYYIPNRLSEGYGLNTKGIDQIKDQGVTLIITTDNGTNSQSEIEYANSLGINVIVTDHHEIPKELPPALAVINPKRLGSDSEFSELAGVGVAFYLACALRAKLRGQKFFTDKEPDLKSYLDLVSLGTIADVAPLTGINRVLVKQGMEILKKTRNPGINALAEAASTFLGEIDANGVAFRLSPRINAAGRLGDQGLPLRLLTTESVGEALEIARALNRMNAERQAIEKKILDQLGRRLNSMDTSRSSIVLWSDEWHPGVIGIAASRLADAHRKPCALISIEGNFGRGSVRSIGNFNIMDTLSSCSEVLTNYGGHTAAGGFDIEIKDLEKFSQQFEKHTSENLSEEERTPTLKLDAEVNLSDINLKLIEELEGLSPFGEGNPKPLLSTPSYMARNVRTVGTNHLKLRISDGIIFLDTIGFGLGDREIDINQSYHFAGIPELNHWNGMTSIQFKLKDIKPTS